MYDIAPRKQHRSRPTKRYEMKEHRRSADGKLLYKPDGKAELGPPTWDSKEKCEIFARHLQRGKKCIQQPGEEFNARVERQRPLPPVISMKELADALKRARAGRSPGPDGIRNEVLKRLTSVQAVLLPLFNSVLRTGRIPAHWLHSDVV